MNTVLKVVVVLISISFPFCCGNPAGVKIAIHKNILNNIEKKFLPIFVEQIGNMKVPDSKIEQKIGLLTLEIYLSKIQFEVHNLVFENINVSLMQPNIIKVVTKKIKGKGSLTAQFKYGILTETDTIELTINNLNADTEVTLSIQDSKKVPGKKMPSAFISKLNLDIDFDFNIDGTVIAFISDIIRKLVRSMLNNLIVSKLEEVIRTQTKDLIVKVIDQLPVYVPLGDTGLSLDYSPSYTLMVANDYILVSSNGAIVNLNAPETMKPPFPIPTTLPDFDSNGKEIQVFLSDYSINTALNTAFLTKMLQVKIKSEEVNAKSPIQFDTSAIDGLITGITKIYGKSKLVDAEITVVERPNVTLENNRINARCIAEIALFVRMDNGANDEATRIRTTLTIDAHGNLMEEGQISAFIHSLQLSNTTIIASKVKDVDVNSMQIAFNFLIKVVTPILNDKYLSKITVNLPSFQGITFGDSTVIINNQRLDLNVSPRFYTSVLTRFFMNTCINEDLQNKKKVQNQFLSILS